MGIESLHGQFSPDMWDAEPEVEEEPAEVEEDAVASYLSRALGNPNVAPLLGQYRTIK